MENHDKSHKPMKLLIFFTFIKIFATLSVVECFIGGNFAFASEIGDSYQVRHERWLKKQENRISKSKRLNTNLNRSDQQAGAGQVSTQNIRNRPQMLPKKLPAKTDQENPQSSFEGPKIMNKNSIVDTGSTQVEIPSSDKVGARPRAPANKKMALDAQEEFINNIPEENEQVQALLNLVDHTKVFYSVNEDGALRDILRDDRFQEIYREEMNPQSRKLTYYFFKGYQDHQRSPNEQVSRNLNRNIRLNRNKIESYLQTTNLKSKLTRSLEGKYPARTPILLPNSETSTTDVSPPTGAGVR